MKIMKSTNIELSMLQQIEDHIKIHNISFAEFIRRAAASYLAANSNVTNVSINDNSVPTEGHVSEPIVQPIDDTPKPKNDFNFDDM